MENNVLKIYPQFTQPAGMVQQKPVDLSFRTKENVRKYQTSIDPKLNTDISKIQDTFKAFIHTSGNLKSDVKKLDNKAFKNKELTKEVLTILSPIAPVRRVSSVPDNVEDGNYARAAGLVALAAVNLPEDFRDIKSAAKQVFKGELPKYDYKNCQAPFSFFRGTALQPLVNKLGKVGIFLHKCDIPLSETKFGQFVIKKLDIDINPFNAEKTGRTVPQVMLDDNGKSIIRDVDVLAYNVQGKPFAKLVGRALLRIPVISFGILALLEVSNIIRKTVKADSAKNKVKEGSRQTLKSVINVISIQTGISMLGALFARKGPAYSLLGMGIGSVVGAYASKGIQKGIDTMTNKD